MDSVQLLPRALGGGDEEKTQHAAAPPTLPEKHSAPPKPPVPPKPQVGIQILSCLRCD